MPSDRLAFASALQGALSPIVAQMLQKQEQEALLQQLEFRARLEEELARASDERRKEQALEVAQVRERGRLQQERMRQKGKRRERRGKQRDKRRERLFDRVSGLEGAIAEGGGLEAQSALALRGGPRRRLSSLRGLRSSQVERETKEQREDRSREIRSDEALITQRLRGPRQDSERDIVLDELRALGQPSIGSAGAERREQLIAELERLSAEEIAALRPNAGPESFEESVRRLASEMLSAGLNEKFTIRGLLRKIPDASDDDRQVIESIVSELVSARSEE